VLEYIASTGVVPKSGIMVGLGEKPEEVLETMDDLFTAGVKVLTIGQYLQPSPKHLEVVEYVTPEQFAFYEKEGLKRGFKYVESGPLVRSSYHAEKHINALK
jgi:lipoic acid synthetase